MTLDKQMLAARKAANASNNQIQKEGAVPASKKYFANALPDAHEDVNSKKPYVSGGVTDDYGKDRHNKLDQEPHPDCEIEPVPENSQPEGHVVEKFYFPRDQINKIGEFNLNDVFKGRSPVSRAAADKISLSKPKTGGNASGTNYEPKPSDMINRVQSNFERIKDMLLR